MYQVLVTTLGAKIEEKVLILTEKINSLVRSQQSNSGF